MKRSASPLQEASHPDQLVGRMYDAAGRARLRLLARAPANVVNANADAGGFYVPPCNDCRRGGGFGGGGTEGTWNWVRLKAGRPWQYENPPIGDTSRSIERHYPTMTIEQFAHCNE